MSQAHNAAVMAGDASAIQSKLDEIDVPYTKDVRSRVELLVNTIKANPQLAELLRDELVKAEI